MTQSHQMEDNKTPVEKSKATATIDDLINSTNIKPDNVKIESSSDDYSSPEPINQDVKEHDNEKEQRERKNEKEEEKVNSSSGKAAAEDVDEYGNDIPKPRVYTQEEVNRMMRERFNRGSFANQQQTHAQQNATPQQVQQAAEGFKPDPHSTDSWDVQLNKFIDHRLNQNFDSLYKQQKEKEKNDDWKIKESKKQEEFEHKFSTGMERYKDFREVAATMPITDAMMIAAREFKDPAAFVYAASKNYADDIKRISQLPDPYQQAVEIGRLEERMRKNRAVTKAAPPLKAPSGDMSEKVAPKYNIDHAIHSHAKRRAGR